MIGEVENFDGNYFNHGELLIRISILKGISIVIISSFFIGLVNGLGYWLSFPPLPLFCFLFLLVSSLIVLLVPFSSSHFRNNISRYTLLFSFGITLSSVFSNLYWNTGEAYIFFSLFLMGLFSLFFDQKSHISFFLLACSAILCLHLLVQTDTIKLQAIGKVALITVFSFSTCFLNFVRLNKLQPLLWQQLMNNIAFNQAQDALLIYDDKTEKILASNLKLAELLNLKADPTLKKSDSKIFVRTMIIGKIPLEKSDDSFSTTIKIQDFKGKFKWLELLSFRLPNLQNYLLIRMSDVSLRLKSEQAFTKSVNYLHLVLKNAPLVVFVLNKSGEFEIMFGRDHQKFTLNSGEVIGKSYLKVFKNYPWFISQVEKVLEGKYAEIDADFNGLHYNVSFAPFHDMEGRDFGVIGVAYDTTNQKVAEEETRRIVGQLTERNQELQRFADISAHDLKEPLRSITNFLQLLEKKYGSDLNEEAKEYIQFAVNGGKQMHALINDLGIYTRIEVPKEAYVEVDLNSLLKETIGLFKAEIADKNILVDTGLMPTVVGHKKLIGLVFENLLSNSIKYLRGEDSKVSFTSAIGEDEKFYIFQVSDNGIGIEDEYQSYIFGVFSKLHGKDKFGGTGIGLAICKKIIKRHGGDIWLESKLNVGTTITFTLPNFKNPKSYLQS